MIRTQDRCRHRARVRCDRIGRQTDGVYWFSRTIIRGLEWPANLQTEAGPDLLDWAVPTLRSADADVTIRVGRAGACACRARARSNVTLAPRESEIATRVSLELPATHHRNSHIESCEEARSSQLRTMPVFSSVLL